MVNTIRPIHFILLATSIVMGVALVGSASALPQQAASSPQASAYQAPPDVKAPPADAQKSKSGLSYKVVKPGTGTEHPTINDRVTVNYTGWTTDGKMFDSTGARGKPSTFMLMQVLPGWTEGVQLMVVGETRRFWVPEKLAFNGAAGRPQGTVVFDIELLDVTPVPELQAPPDVAAPPADATKTKSGLASKVIKPGAGTEHPGKSSVVTAKYTGWTTDGKWFDSWVVRGQPLQFPLDKVIAGWTEGVQLITAGEIRRFWIPEKLAYGGQDGKPKGMLVFDVELISFAK